LSRDVHFHFPASSRRAKSFGSVHTGPQKVVAVTFFCRAMTLRKVGFFQLFDVAIKDLMNEGLEIWLVAIWGI
jgi:hypothetical protein